LEVTSADLSQEGVSITRMLRFNPCGTGKEVWERLAEAGELWEKPNPEEPTGK